LLTEATVGIDNVKDWTATLAEYLRSREDRAITARDIIDLIAMMKE
jgi:hypothetical protein